MSEDLIEQLHDLAKSCGWEHGTPTGQTAYEAAAEIERLRAKLAEVEAKKISLQDDVVPGLIARAEAAEKRLASAKEVIEPFRDRYTELMEMPAAKYAAATDVEVSHLRAAAEWMEKGDE